MKYIIVFFPFIFSCISTKHVHEYPSSKLTSANLSEFNGIYYNEPVPAGFDEEREDLYKFFFRPFKVYKSREYRDFNGKISIEFKNESELQVGYINDGQLIKTKTFKGEIHNGYFCFRRKIRYFGLPFIYLVYRQRDRYLGFDNQYKLVTKARRYDIANIFIFSGGGNDGYGDKYSKVPAQ